MKAGRVPSHPVCLHVRHPRLPQIYQERFSRCLDLYLCPREPKLKTNPKLQPRDLLPELPKPRDLQPFPTQVSLNYVGHKGSVTCVSSHPDGRVIASGGVDRSVRVWEVATGRCLRLFELEDSVSDLEFSPTPAHTLLLAGSGESVLIINHKIGNSRFFHYSIDLTFPLLVEIIQSCPEFLFYV